MHTPLNAPLPSSPVAQPHHRTEPSILPEIFPVAVDVPIRADDQSQQWSTAVPTPINTILPAQSPLTQISQSLENMQGYRYQLCGVSSNADPWLLRHCKFDDYGFQKFFNVHFRNAGGVPTRQLIPAHFAVTQQDATSIENEAAQDQNLRAELATMVPLNHGQRLLRLFMKRVFPILPILSRSHLGLGKEQDIPEPHVLGRIPAHLLAAIYATAFSFAAEDDYLSLTAAHEKPPISKLWQFVHRLVIKDSPYPQLSILQAGILYIHRQIENSQRDVVAEAASIWSLMGMMVGVANSLGLNLECRLFGLPDYEKRIRRRLWWAIYNEDKWISLTFGRPPYIRSSEWDVSQLVNSDFMTPYAGSNPGSKVEDTFKSMTSLAVIAESVQEKLYSLRASQNLAEDISASVEIAKPLLQSLRTWRESLPMLTSGSSVREMSAGGPERLPSTIYHAYLVLLLYIWRALLRTTVRSSDPPQVIHIQDMSESATNIFRDFDWGFDYLPAIEVPANESLGENSTVVIELYEAAISCATSITDFMSSLDYAAYSQFWYSYRLLIAWRSAALVRVGRSGEIPDTASSHTTPTSGFGK
ncbi:fungal specific transcription factor [Fusarium flagelliforme]|uniref:Fungal specific transcription factor n=1 Tax=Fusarium flagelliforme TaxID=2675880 RepID=A0A395M550_9HYPO|nr:fungal specific transcription factor [Fusarium flagelliforme]